jgi:hypothetical protein
MFSPVIAAALVERGIDCMAVAGRPLLRALDDRDVIEAALGEGRILVTNNVGDFERLRRERDANAMAVPGLIYTSDDVFPRSRTFFGIVAASLEDAARHHLVAPYGGVPWLKPVEERP